MKNLTLENIANACCGTYHGDASLFQSEVNHVVIDSRNVKTDDLFVAIKGERVDGHSFIPQVMESGALCSVSEQDLGHTSYPYILVDSTAQALLDISKLYRESFDIKVVGISGSVGKTSTKEMIASVLSEKYNVHKTKGNLNSESGLPLTIFELNDSHEVSVLEMGINHFGEMRKLSTVAQPDICVITNIGVAHLEFLKTQEGILKEKTQMFQDIKPGGFIIVNGDDPLLSTVQPIRGAHLIRYGTSSEHTIYASDIKPLGLKGSSCVIHTPDGEFTCTVPTPGTHMVSNALAGAACGYALGLTPEQIQAGIEHLPFLPGRNNIIQTDKVIILDDCYNANPVSMKAAIDVLTLGIGRKVAIVGNMGELGANEAELHHNVGLYLAEKNIDVICAVGELAKYIAEAFQEGNSAGEVYWFESKDALIPHLKEIIHSGDNILVKASNSMHFSHIVETLKDL